MQDESKSTPLCLHHNDRDGACAAWVVRKLHPDVECIAVQYGEPPRLVEAAGRDVFVVDFSWPAAELRQLADVASSLLIIDHHKTAHDPLLAVVGATGVVELVDYEINTIRIVFDLERSGAGLTWDTLFPGEPRPWFVDYVEDRDLWRWALPSSEAVNAYLSTLPSIPEAFDVFRDPVGGWGHYPPYVADGGSAVLRYRDKLVARICANADRDRLSCRPGAPADIIPIVNSPVLQSEIGHVLAKGEPFAAVWYEDADGVRRWSLRSDEDGLDVAAIAKCYGGGGHKHAAGFKE